MIDSGAVKANIFPGAHDAIWQAFPWHKGAASPHSSQALAVSVFGTLAVHPLQNDLIDETLGLVFGWNDAGVDWRVDLEWTLASSLLGERTPTAVDVLLHSKRQAVLLECKFTEPGGGPCSQPKPLSSGRHKGLIQCDGNYREQVNPINNKAARCALSAKGIRYWQFIPAYFDLDSGRDYEPCPFAGPAYQYMRNVIAAGQWARRKKMDRVAFALIYAAGNSYPVSNEAADTQSEWAKFVASLRSDSSVVVQAISYQRLLEIWCRSHPDDRVLAELDRWVTERICSVEQTM